MSAPCHDVVVEQIARTRFPLPGQQTWPEGYITITNVPSRTRPIRSEAGTHYPDIIIVDRDGRTREVGEVEMSVDDAVVDRLRMASEAADDDTPTRVRHFFIYVPAGLEAEAQRLLDENAISYAGVRGFAADPSGFVKVTPFVTKGDPADHR